MIIRGGENIYPREIEAVVHQLPQIAEAAVVGRPNPVYGEEPVLFVSLHARTRELDTERDPRSHRRVSSSKYKLAGRDHDSRRPAQEPRRQDRQARSASAAGRLARHHADRRELIMSFTKPELPPVDPGVSPWPGALQVDFAVSPVGIRPANHAVAVPYWCSGYGYLLDRHTTRPRRARYMRQQGEGRTWRPRHSTGYRLTSVANLT